MAGQINAECFPEDQAGLTILLQEVEQKLAECSTEIKRMLASEDPAAGIYFASELHKLKQSKVSLEYKKEFCRTRLQQFNLPV